MKISSIFKIILILISVYSETRKELGFTLYMVEYLGSKTSFALELRKDKTFESEDPYIVSITNSKTMIISKNFFRKSFPDMFFQIINASGWVFSVIDVTLSVIENIEITCNLAVIKGDGSTCFNDSIILNTKPGAEDPIQLKNLYEYKCVEYLDRSNKTYPIAIFLPKTARNLKNIRIESTDYYGVLPKFEYLDQRIGPCTKKEPTKQNRNEKKRSN